jgi:NTP pyrophosphatase (non-canonical NTP hydrolase)
MAKFRVNEQYLPDAINGDRKALMLAFVFSDTPHGHEYWARFAYRGKPLTVEARVYLQSLLDENEAATPVIDAPSRNDCITGGALMKLAHDIHGQNVRAGWWDNPREMGTLLMLVVSEIAEAMEGDRKGLQDDHLPHRPMVEVELADAIIRILDIAAYHGLDLDGAVHEKLQYNMRRLDHTREARAQNGGKKY